LKRGHTKAATTKNYRKSNRKKKPCLCREILHVHRALFSSFRATKKRTSSFTSQVKTYTVMLSSCITYTGWIMSVDRWTDEWTVTNRNTCNVNLPCTKVYRHASAT